MVQKVIIRKGDNKFRVHFMYNTDLVDIMQEHQGWWFRKEKCWQFPLWKFEAVYDHLSKEKYKIEIKKIEEKEKPKTQTKLEIDYWAEPDVVAVPGNCKQCGEWHFLNREGLCHICRDGGKDE